MNFGDSASRREFVSILNMKIINVEMFVLNGYFNSFALANIGRRIFISGGSINGVM